MGSETTKALQARRRQSAAKIERLIAKADDRSPIGSVGRARIKEAARLARRKVCALAAAQDAVTAIEAELGLALLKVVDQGISRSEAFELVGLSRHLGRRYLDVAANAQTQVRAGSSTAEARDDALNPVAGDVDPNDPGPGAIPTGRKV